MSEPKWTPGPWEAKLIDGYSHIHPVEGWGGSGEIATVWTPSEANARLIAAAPDLYAQLEDARVTLEEAAKLMVSRYPSVANNLVNQCGIRCGDVLAKARGEP